MLRILALVCFALALVACGPPVQTCVTLGWECGTDDLGHSCGTCTAGRTCSRGTCIGGNPTCSCLGLSCGDDGCGHSCGTCTSPASCSAGICRAATCDARVFTICTASSLCCDDPIRGVASLCTDPLGTGGLTYCEPVCVTTSDCAGYGTGGWTCATRTDGIRVCIP